MGYTTEFTGAIKIEPPLTKEQAAYIDLFSNTRRVTRDEAKCSLMPDPVRIAAGIGEVGPEGIYFTGGLGFQGQDYDQSLIKDSPSKFGPDTYWCDWVTTHNGQYLVWNEREKFYQYTECLAFLIEHFFKRWRRTLNGTLRWSGEENGDTGSIRVVDNKVIAQERGRHKPTLLPDAPAFRERTEYKLTLSISFEPGTPQTTIDKLIRDAAESAGDYLVGTSGAMDYRDIKVEKVNE